MVKPLSRRALLGLAGSASASAVAASIMVRIGGKPVATNPLVDLVLTGTTFATDSPAGTVIGNITLAHAGSTISVSPADGKLSVVAGQLLVGATPSTAGTATYTLVENWSVWSHNTTITVTVNAAGSFVTLTPTGSWDGTGLTGGNHVTDGFDPSASRVTPTATASPAIQWVFPSEQRFTDDTVIGVQAMALGGISHVDFWVEGAIATGVTRSIYNYVDPNGVTHALDGFWIKIGIAAAAAAHNRGEIRVFAKATANDGTMATRCIGNAPNFANDRSNNNNGDYIWRCFASTTLWDFSYTVATSNNDVSPNFTTLKKAMDQAAADGAGLGIPATAQITFTQTGTYELQNRTGNYGGFGLGPLGYTTIKAAPGVTATLGRAAKAGENFSTDFGWFQSFEKLEFRGSGIVIDYRNVAFFDTTLYGFWLNGCKLSSSAPPASGFTSRRDSADWYKGIRPAGVGGVDYVTDCWIEFIRQPTTFLRIVARNSFHETYGIMYTASHYVSRNRAKDANGNFFRRNNGAFAPAIQVSYSGAATTATVSTSTGPGGEDSPQTLTLTLNGSTDATIQLGAKPSNTNYNASDVVAAINTHGNGWSATLLDDTFHAALMKGFNLNAKAGPVTLVSGYDTHTDFWQDAAFGTNGRVNAIIEDNVQLGTATDGFQLYFFQGKTADVMFRNNVSNVGQSLPSALGSTQSHVCNFGAFGGAMRTDANSGGSDAYCAWIDCVISAIDLQNNPWNPYPAYKNCVYVGSALTGTADGGGNIACSSGEMTTILAGLAANDDPRPAGILLNSGNLRAPLPDVANDHLGNAWSNPRPIGATMSGLAQPSYGL